MLSEPLQDLLTVRDIFEKLNCLGMGARAHDMLSVMSVPVCCLIFVLAKSVCRMFPVRKPQ